MATSVSAPQSTATAVQFGRRAFRVLNRWLSVPMLRAGLGAWLATPVGGWILLLRVRGRRTGMIREVPLSYLIAEGSAWVMAGFGRRCDWYWNLIDDPEVEVVLPGRSIRCRAEEVGDGETRERIVPALVRAAGVPGYLSGCDPYRAPAVQVLRATESVPLIRLHPVGEPLVAGPDDPGGLGWAWRQAVVAVILLALLGVARRQR